MTLKIELTPQEQRRLLGAKARGVDVQALIRGLIAGLPELPETELTNQEIPPRTDFTLESHRPRATPQELEAFLAAFATKGAGKGYLLPEAFDRETLYEDRL